MSNHTRTEVRFDATESLRRECLDDLARCDRLSSGVQQQLSATQAALANIGRSLAGELAAASQRIAALDPSMVELRASAQELGAQVAAVEARQSQLERQTRVVLEEAESGNARGMERLAQSRLGLSELQSGVTRDLERTREIARRLEEHFERAETLLSQVAAQRDEGSRIGEGVDRSWDQLQEEHRRFAEARDSWSAIRADLEAADSRTRESFRHMDLLLDALGDASMATYGVIKALAEEGFTTVAYQRSAHGIEAFLRDQDNRLIALQVRPSGEEADKLLLELDLSEFDLEGGNRQCGRCADDILDRLADAGILSGTERQHPHRQDPFEGRLHEASFRRDETHRSQRARDLA